RLEIIDAIYEFYFFLHDSANESLFSPPPNCHHNDNHLLNNCFIPDWLYQLPVQTPSALPFRYNALLQQLLKINLICFATYVT
ncbi:TPA: hypothetical protein ACHKFH_004245, partial [Escherichia coli]